MTKKEARLLEAIFNPYTELLKQGSLNDVDEDWEYLCQVNTSEIGKSASNRYETDTAPTD